VWGLPHHHVRHVVNFTPHSVSSSCKVGRIVPSSPTMWPAGSASLVQQSHPHPHRHHSHLEPTAARPVLTLNLFCVRRVLSLPPPLSTPCRPFPITVASIVTSERSVTPKFFPFEFTPLYVGMPAVAAYNKPIALGGGFVEPLGFNAQPPRKKGVSKTGAEVSVGPCDWHVSEAPSVVHVCPE
jgi:hypothetical protein